jgi:hypothetical protein
MVFFFARGVVLDGSDGGEVEDIKEGELSPPHYKNACKVQARVYRYLVMGSAKHLMNVHFLGDTCIYRLLLTTLDRRSELKNLCRTTGLLIALK